MNVCNGATSCIYYIKKASETEEKQSVNSRRVSFALWLRLLDFNEHLIACDVFLVS